MRQDGIESAAGPRPCDASRAVEAAGIRSLGDRSGSGRSRSRGRADRPCSRGRAGRRGWGGWSPGGVAR
jgi:hypothetical protein